MALRKLCAKNVKGFAGAPNLSLGEPFQILVCANIFERFKTNIQFVALIDRYV